MSSDLESSHDALSIGTIIKVKHRSFCQCIQLNRPLESEFDAPNRLSKVEIQQRDDHSNRHLKRYRF